MITYLARIAYPISAMLASVLQRTFFTRFCNASIGFAEDFLYWISTIFASVSQRIFSITSFTLSSNGKIGGSASRLAPN